MGLSAKRQVEIGRVCLVNFGPDEGQICVVVNVLDSNQAIVDGLTADGLTRQAINFKKLSLTDLKIPGIWLDARSVTVYKCAAKDGTVAKWNATSWAKRRAVRTARANANDFDRFKILIARKKKNQAVAKALNGGKKKAAAPAKKGKVGKGKK